ncbi:di-heme-cytochrome C peroxidase [Sphingomonas tabacisoli]|uniref:Di-heme-cytochrome C peroxidase n=1 Tax=Sphingomonas tabacisoli TaxID=2249466 RepID=A0ABW4I260_9SPHN
MRATRLNVLAGVASTLVASAMISGCMYYRAEAEYAQGWSAADRNGWYYGTQGSRLIPYAWFQALEQADSAAMFADERHLLGYGYIAAAADRPNRLPVGFAIDRQPDDNLKVTKLRWYAGQRGDSAQRAEPWLGFNCSACHTAEIRYQGQPIRVDGGPGLGDFDALVGDLDRALVATRDDPQKWDRFAARVLAGKDTPQNRDALRQAFDTLIGWQQKTANLNRSPVRAGFARVDAFGHIYNKIVLFADDPAQPIVNPADAPVSYPFLWNINKQKQVQWNGAAENARLGNFDYGAMGRNTGEVLGVFGELLPVQAGSPGQPLAGFRSSVNAANLEGLERVVAKLQPPPWPASFPPIDQAKAARGRELFVQHCVACHRTPDRQVPGKPTEVMVPFHSARPENLTDIWMACNALTYESRTGLLRNTKDGFVSGEALPAVAPVVTMLATSVKGALVGKKGQIVATAAGGFLGLNRPIVVFQGDVVPTTPEQVREGRRAFCTTTDHRLLAYKARPLEGIWATAPYLHNGSVPTLYHLLLPADQRPRSFHLGTRDYDPRYVGYDWRPEAPGNSFRFDAYDGSRPRDANANVGHDYGASAMSDADRWALVEYLKTL